MATSVSIAIADQMVTDLAASGLTPSFTPARLFLPRSELKKMAGEGNKVFIAPSDRQGQRASRAQRQYTHSIDLALVAKIATEEAAQQELLDKLIEDLADWYFIHPLGSSRPETLETVVCKCLFDPDELLNNKVFCSVITLNWRAFRTT